MHSGGARRGGLTCGLDELGVGVVRDDGDGQVPEVQLKRTGDDVDVFIRVHRDVRLLAVWVEKTNRDIGLQTSRDERNWIMKKKYGNES